MFTRPHSLFNFKDCTKIGRKVYINLASFYLGLWNVRRWCKSRCSQKEGVLWKQTTHTPSDVDPGVYVLQIGLTPTDNFPFPKLKLLLVLLDSSMIHRLTDTSTQQFNDSHFLSCTSTLMQFQKKFFILIHRICTSLTAQAILAISSSQKERRGSDRSPMYCPPSP
jgi:hypothetical protein